jgi:hypothetical protein
MKTTTIKYLGITYTATPKTAPFAKVFGPTENGWALVIGESWRYFQSMQEAITAADKHNARR